MSDRVLLLFGSELYASAEYCKHFIRCLNGVHAFGYNSTESEPIWMKYAALWVSYIVRGGPRRFWARSVQ